MNNKATSPIPEWFFPFMQTPTLWSHFPGVPGLADTRMFPLWILWELRMTEVVVTTGAIRCAKLQSNRHHQQTKHPTFYKPDALPVTQSTVSKHMKGS